MARIGIGSFGYGLARISHLTLHMRVLPYAEIFHVQTTADFKNKVTILFSSIYLCYRPEDSLS